MRWYRLAAENRNAGSQSNIGYLYTNAGQAKAENNIGYMIANGAGVTKDCAIPKRWFERAAAAGNELARINLQNGASGACQW
jgi:TPR repeat protein